eukprot:TRINITY_DN1102_c0_g1_i1.p1 TRINITY_DN1102_c0_g1~~TRINITY_DN1102_c0_g1_i1.p1  ORF type:complete len:242 (+),score=31.52 TRINITY_DN1102_c0_g1_i1:91-816(+)
MRRRGASVLRLGATRWAARAATRRSTAAWRNTARISVRTAPRFYSSNAHRFGTRSLLFSSLAVGGIAAGALSYNIIGCDGVPHVGQPGTRFERTFIAVKPDGVNRGLTGEIIQRFERKGYKLVGLKLVYPTRQFAEKHYADLSKKPFFPGLVKYFSSGPVVAMVWEGKNVIKNGRKIVGATNPDDSEAGSIRGDLCIDIGRNIIHGSDCPEGAAHEITLWFNQSEISSYERSDVVWLYEKV